jgi:hypothetical protein
VNKSLALIVIWSLSMSLSFAYEMHGTLNDNNDGTYQVNMVSSSGREYLGLADQQGDGTLDINVAIQGGGSEIYLGTAKLNADGNYDLNLRNNTTGELATGSLEKSS